MHAWLLAFRPRRLRIISRPVTQSVDGSAFVFHPRGRSFRQSLPYSWESLDPVLPSLRGTIALHRFGPIVLLRIDAFYRIAADLPGRLLEESVGRKSGLASLRCLCQCLHRMLTEAAEAAHAVR